MADTCEQPRKRQRTDDSTHDAAAAVVAVVAESTPQEDSNEGRFCHIEYASTDMEATSAFFAKLFNWPAHKSNTMHYYPLPKVCAHSRPRQEGEVDSVVSHINVSDINETLKRATAAGAKVVTPKTPVDSHGFFATVRAPGDVLQAFWQCASKSKAESNGHEAAEPTAAAAKENGEVDPDPAKRKPKSTSIAIISLVVSDQDQALEFYCSKLGFEKHTDMTTPEYRWVTIKPPKQEGIEISLLKPATEDDKAVVGRQTGSIPFLVINTDDVQYDYERLKALGVEFTQPPTDRFYGIESLLRDPFGNIINLIQPKDH